MNLTATRVTLYGRFLKQPRNTVVHQLKQMGSVSERDLTRRSDILVVGSGALSLVPSGHLLRKLRQADNLSVPVIPEARFWSMLNGESAAKATYPINTLELSLIEGLPELLNAFDVISFDGQHCRFGDVATLQSAMELYSNGHDVSSIIRLSILAKRFAPRGRHKVVPGDDYSVRLLWDDGETEIDGQGLLQLSDQPTLDDVFERALLAEAEGEIGLAIRDYEVCAHMDRSDPLAPFNLGNVLLQLDRLREAKERYSQAIGRDPKMAEAYYNRAQVEEKMNAIDLAVVDLEQALEIDPGYVDAMFNLAQLLVKVGRGVDAAMWFERFAEASSDPEAIDLALKAKRAALS